MTTVLTSLDADTSSSTFLAHCEECGWPLYEGDRQDNEHVYCQPCRNLIETPGAPAMRTDPRSPPEAAFYTQVCLSWPRRTAHLLKPQFPVPAGGKMYLADFAITFPWARLLIEIDGREFHSSREDRQKDYRRERALIEEGWTVLRFTGVDIYHGVAYCADQVWRILRRRALEYCEICDLGVASGQPDLSSAA